MSQDSSFVGTFDLKSQAGVMSVLAAIRASNLSPTDKNELRDLVFSYSNGGGDASVRNLLEQKLAAHQIVPVVMQRAGQAAPVLSFGTYRPTPAFKTTVPTTPVPQPAPAPVFYKNAVPNTATPPPAAPAPVSPTPNIPAAPQPVAQTAQPQVVPQQPQPQVVPQQPLPVTPVASIPVVAEVPVPQQPTPTPVPPTPPVPPAPAPAPLHPAPAPANVSAPDAGYLERIRQIKTAVNSKVGNPVNLVDINNEVGREYMNALLEAMKKLGSGAVSEMEPAMARLESAYAAVEVAIKKHNGDKDSAPAAPIPTPKPEPVPVEEPLPVPIPPPIIPVEPASNSVYIPPPPLNPKPEPDRSAVWQASDNTASPQTEVNQIEINRVPVRSELETTPAKEVTTASLAESTKILTPKDLPDAATLPTGDKGDPLETREIDDGLNQLLSDWSLFKKSGLFGTGPKGIEHPLYKKIADLQVPLLLAGRFDGASQEIRQSVTDYMNGWRYEQGIVYLPGETFEKYLRRVIKHILDLQKKR